MMKKNYTLLLLIILATVLQYKQYIMAYGADNVVQIASGINLFKGNHISMPSINYGDWSDVKYNSVGDWAPGIAVCVAALYPIFNDPIAIIYSLIFIYITLFFCSIGLLIIKIPLSSRALVFIMLFIGICYAPFRYLNPSGVASLSMLVLGMYLCFLWIEREERGGKMSILSLVLTGFVFFLPSFFRFAYYPSGFALILTYAVTRIVNRENLSFRSISIVGVSLIFFICVQFYYQYSLNTINFLESNELFKREKFLYLENVMLANPIALNTFFPTSTWMPKVSFLRSFSQETTFLIAHSLSIAIVWCTYSLIQNKLIQSKHSSYKKVIIILLVSALVNWFFMFALSLYYPSWNLGVVRTFTTLERYLASVCLFFVLGGILSCSSRKWGYFFMGTVLIFNLMIYVNSFLVYGIGDLEKQMDILLPGRFESKINIEKHLLKEETNVILSDLVVETYDLLLNSNKVSVGDLSKSLAQAKEQGVNVSKPTQVLVLSYHKHKQAVERDLEEVFGKNSVMKININQERPLAWSVMLYPN